MPPEFFAWLTDPVKNGAGALYDFGCYGANLMTWMMDNQRPIAVTALTSRFKPKIYPRVDDEATRRSADVMEREAGDNCQNFAAF